MTRVGGTGEPVSRGRRDLDAAERRALGDTLFAAGLFALVVLVNGILAFLAIGLVEAAGLLGVSAEPNEGARAVLSDHLHLPRSELAA